jgi:O-antigen/teichoic acid export membrane protein
MWLFIVGAGMPVSLQAGRILLAHVSTPIELSQYALMSQFYGLCSTLLATAGVAYWPIFVKRQGESDVTVHMWWQLTAAFAGLAVIATGALVLLSPPVATVLTGSRIDVSMSLALAFGMLLVVQSAHLPSNVLLTRPNEARWQALWTLPMILLTAGLGVLLASQFGAVGAVYASVLAIFLAQVLPDLAWVPRLVRRRPVDDAAAVSPEVPPPSPPG